MFLRCSYIVSNTLSVLQYTALESQSPTAFITCLGVALTAEAPMRRYFLVPARCCHVGTMVGGHSDRPRSVSLIDGGWVDKARRSLVSDGRWDLQSFADRLVPKHHWRFRTYYFDALPFKDRYNPTEGQQKQYYNKDEELKSIDRLERFTVRCGYCKKTRVSGYLKDGGYQATPTEITTVEQKMVDVLLATEMTRIAWSKEALHIGLVAGDGDYVAAVGAAKGAGAIVRLFYVKTRATSVAPELFDIVDERVDLTSVFQDMEAGRPIPIK